MFSDKKIVAIGDSITYGFPYTCRESWFDLAAAKLGFEYINQGINGDSTTWMYCRFKTDVLAHQPTHVIIMGGTNDAYCDEPLTKVLDNIKQMIHLAKANKITPIVGIPIPCDDAYTESLLAEYRAQMHTYINEQQLASIDFYTAMRDKNGQIPSGLHMDGVHPNIRGYQRMSELAIDSLRRILNN